jgi:REP element-mobilizing transposase RayT
MILGRSTWAAKQRGWEPFPGRLWQRNYYERIIRNEDELNRIREYIIENPQNWATDRENPANMAANKTLQGTSP